MPKVTYTGCGQGSAPRTHCGTTPCQTEPEETARSWPDRGPRTGGALQGATAPGSTWMEWLGDRGLLKETENTLAGVGQEHTALDTGQVPAHILSITEGQPCPLNLLLTFVPSFVP